MVITRLPLANGILLQLDFIAFFWIVSFLPLILMTSDEYSYSIMTNTVQTKYLHVEGEIPVDIQKGTFISIQRKTPLKIYSLGFQPGKSIPEIPRWFLYKYARKELTILEPFAGSGTSIIEAIKNQLKESRKNKLPDEGKS